MHPFRTGEQNRKFIDEGNLFFDVLQIDDGSVLRDLVDNVCQFADLDKAARRNDNFDLRGFAGGDHRL